MSQTTQNALLVAGVPRSSTTWTAALLAAACGEAGLVEPDNHHHQPLTLVAKRGLGSFPVLRPGADAPAFADHWRRVFAGNWPRYEDPASRAADDVLDGMDRAARDRALLEPDAHHELYTALSDLLDGHHAPADRPVSRVVKSVQLCLALDWFAAQMPDVRIVVVERHPLDVTASWLSQYGDDLGPLAPGWREKLELGDRIPDEPSPDAPLIVRIAWKVGLLQTAQHAAAEQIGCRVLAHEQICIDAERRFAALARDLDLPYPEAAAAKARETNRPGSGYEITRVRAGLPGSARKRLSGADVAVAQRSLAEFEIAAART